VYLDWLEKDSNGNSTKACLFYYCFGGICSDTMLLFLIYIIKYGQHTDWAWSQYYSDYRQYEQRLYHIIALGLDPIKKKVQRYLSSLIHQIYNLSDMNCFSSSIKSSNFV